MAWENIHLRWKELCLGDILSSPEFFLKNTRHDLSFMILRKEISLDSFYLFEASPFMSVYILEVKSYWGKAKHLEVQYWIELGHCLYFQKAFIE